MENILDIKNITKHFKEFSLDGVTFSLPRGYIMGLIGPNGAGMSTIMKLIMNLISIDSGTIKLFGLDNIVNEEEIKDRIGYVGEEQYFYEDKKIVWIERFVSKFYKKWDSDKFYSLLDKFDVDKYILKGGTWRTSMKYAETIYRFGLNPEVRDEFIGFRILMPTQCSSN